MAIASLRRLCGGVPRTTTENVEESSVLGKFEKFNRRLCGGFEWLGIAAMLLMMVITCIDVVGAKVFRSPILGALDIVQLSQIMAIAFALSMAQVLRRHVQVESFFRLLPGRAQAVINIIVSLIVFVFFIVIIWQLCVLGYSFQTSGEYSPTAYIPLYPFAYVIALACIPFCLVLLVEFVNSLKQKVAK
jgi:TRAP-type C4-dicarboxylate transport system permease small subunit